MVLSNFFFRHYVFKKPSAAEASESVYIRERFNLFPLQVLLQKTTFENIVTKEKISPLPYFVLNSIELLHFHLKRFLLCLPRCSKYRLLQIGCLC